MILLKFDKVIKGTSSEANHKDWITIDSWSLSAARLVQVNGKDREPGVAHVSELAMSKSTDIASANLFIEAVNGKSLGKATLHILQTGGSSAKNQPYLEIILDQPMITSYSVSGGEGRPTEHFQLNFTKITYEYKEFTGDTITATVTKSFDMLDHSAS